MLPPHKQAIQDSNELDRYLLEDSEASKLISPEEEPYLHIELQLLQLDFKEQSQIRSTLRRALEQESGTQNLSSSEKLIRCANSRRRISSSRHWKSWSAFIAVVVLLFIWTWSSSGNQASMTTSPLSVSPEVIPAAAPVSNPGTVTSDPRPVPTPLAPPATRTFLPSQPYQSLQHTPFLTFAITPDNLAP